MGLPQNDKDSAVNKIKIVPLIFAGLIDSINPCAFATIIFFISYLSLVLKKQRTDIFLTGIIFIAGVFITYLLIGLGFFRIVQKLNNIIIISKTLYIAVGILGVAAIQLLLN